MGRLGKKVDVESVLKKSDKTLEKWFFTLTFVGIEPRTVGKL